VKPPRTLRGRLFAYIALAIAISTVLTVGVAGLLIHGRAQAQALTNLERQADAVAGSSASVTGTRVFRASHGRDRALGPSSPVALAVQRSVPAGDGRGRIRAQGRALLYAARTVPGGRIVLVRSPKLASPDWEPYLISVLLAGLGGALVAALASLFLARRLAGPLRALALASGKLARGEEVEVPADGPEEVAAVGRAFNATASELARARDAQRTFLLSVSHELKTPLTAVQTYAEALGEGAIEPSEAAATIGRESERLERLVGDLLDLGRLERHAFEVRREPFDLRETAEAACAPFRARAAELGVGLELAADRTSWAQGDPGRAIQILTNLLENALRVTPPGGRVTVTVSGSHATVRDTGPGLTEEDLPRAFERFYLHERYRSDRPVGSGLGLAIVHELVQAMGGEVTASAAPGGGAEFHVQLPPAERRATTATSPETRATPTP